MSFDPITAQDLDPPDTSRPKICVPNRQMREITQDAIDALRLANCPPTLFQNNGRLVMIGDGDDGLPAITPVDEAALRHRLNCVADWTGLKEGSATKQPKEVAIEVLQRKRWPEFAELEAVVPAPVLVPDSALLVKPGYDPRSKIFVANTDTLEPWAGDVHQAVDFLRSEVLAEFPFRSEADQANAFALLFELFLRPSLRSCTPFYVIDAINPGSGKSYLGRVICAIYAGLDLQTRDAPVKEEEWAKTLLSAMQTAPAIMFFDDMKGKVESAALARTLTSERSKGRALGSNRELSGTNRSTWLGSCNKATLSRDIVLRSVWIRLDPKRDDPDQRDFRRPDLILWVLRNRGQLLGAVQAIVNGWHAAGRPVCTTAKHARFPLWSHMLGGLLEYAGISGFLGNQDVMAATLDLETEAWRKLYRLASEHFGAAPVESKALYELIQDDEVFGTILSTSSPVQSLGMRLKKEVGQVRSCIELSAAADGPKGAKRFVFRALPSETSETSETKPWSRAHAISEDTHIDAESESRSRRSRSLTDEERDQLADLDEAEGTR